MIFNIMYLIYMYTNLNDMAMQSIFMQNLYFYNFAETMFKC